MTEKIVIIGGGQASISCASHLRTNGFDAEIFLICEENFYPYQRPPLSKKFLTGNFLEERLLLKKTDYYKANNIQVIFSIAEEINREKKEIYLRPLNNFLVSFFQFCFLSNKKINFDLNINLTIYSYYV